MEKSGGKGLIWGTYVVIMGTNKAEPGIPRHEKAALPFDLFSFLYTNAVPDLTRGGVCLFFWKKGGISLDTRRGSAIIR